MPAKGQRSKFKGMSLPDRWLHDPRQCPTCETTFRPSREQRYCSEPCRRFGLGYCDGCGEPFEKTGSTARFCSDPCRRRTKAEREAIRWKTKRSKQDKERQLAKDRTCALPCCRRLLPDKKSGRKYHEDCARVVHLLKERVRKRVRRAHAAGIPFDPAPSTADVLRTRFAHYDYPDTAEAEATALVAELAAGVMAKLAVPQTPEQDA